MFVIMPLCTLSHAVITSHNHNHNHAEADAEAWFKYLQFFFSPTYIGPCEYTNNEVFLRIIQIWSKHKMVCPQKHPINSSRHPVHLQTLGLAIHIDKGNSACKALSRRIYATRTKIDHRPKQKKNGDMV
jgi:hypothetical protein